MLHSERREMTVHTYPCDISQDSSTEHLLAYPMVDAERARKRTVSMRDLYQVWSSALSAKEIEDITTTAMRQASQEATTFSAATEIQEKRSCTVRWLPDQWIKDLLWTYVQQANQDAFHIDVEDRHLGAGDDKLPDGLLAQPRAAAGDNCGLAFHIHDRSPFPGLFGCSGDPAS